MYRHIRKRSEVVGSTLRKRWFNLIGVDHSALPHQFRKKSRVVTSARANMDNPFAFLRSQRCETQGVQCWLPIVERSFAAKGYDNILIQNSRIIRERLDISRAGEHFPRWRPDKLLPRSRRQRSGELATGRDTSLGGY